LFVSDGAISEITLANDKSPGGGGGMARVDYFHQGGGLMAVAPKAHG
jgi:hypothetical protein